MTERNDRIAEIRAEGYSQTYTKHGLYQARKFLEHFDREFYPPKSVHPDADGNFNIPAGDSGPVNHHDEPGGANHSAGPMDGGPIAEARALTCPTVGCNAPILKDGQCARGCGFAISNTSGVRFTKEELDVVTGAIVDRFVDKLNLAPCESIGDVLDEIAIRDANGNRNFAALMSLHQYVDIRSNNACIQAITKAFNATKPVPGPDAPTQEDYDRMKAAHTSMVRTCIAHGLLSTSEGLEDGAIETKDRAFRLRVIELHEACGQVTARATFFEEVRLLLLPDIQDKCDHRFDGGHCKDCGKTATPEDT